MDLRYEAFCFADRYFYDVEGYGTETANSWVSTLSALGPGWRRFDRGDWHVCLPEGLELPMQGWKVHVAASADDAPRVLEVVRPYSVQCQLAFKFLRSPRIYANRNAKYADRSVSGKLITIYPTTVTQLKNVLDDLSDRLAGIAAPDIPGDLRYGNVPLHVRYGGFVERMITDTRGAEIPALERPDGRLVPEPGTQGLQLPEWVRVPDFLRPHLDAQQSEEPSAYQVTKALKLTNAGGVYLAVRKQDDRQVVVKQARPYTGLDPDGADAVTRLDREARTLTLLAGVPGVPEVLDRITWGSSETLVLSAMPGITLSRWLARNYPLTQREVSRTDRTRYTERALAVLGRIERLLSDVHRRGLVFGDLNDHNILVDEDDSVSFVDFELAFPAVDRHRPAGGLPGFRAPSDRTGYEVDRYAFAVLRLWMFLPMTMVLDLEPDKLADFVRQVRKRFDLPLGYLEEVLAELRPRAARPARRRTALDQPEVNWISVRRSIADGVLHSATPHRADRLFPGDILQYSAGGTGFGHGAAGVLYALDAAGFGRFPAHEKWLLDAVRRQSPVAAGFWDGAHGTIHVLENFGHHEAADELLEKVEPRLPRMTGHGLRTGLAGIGLNLLHLAASRQDAGHLWQAIEIGDRLTAMLDSAPLTGPDVRGRAGLMHGWSGPALLFLRLFERTRERGWLDHADLAVRRDLMECARTPDGTLQVRDRQRTLPYLEVGSAGIALVMEELLAIAPGASVGSELPRLRRALLSEFVIQPGLMLGRAGLIGALAAGLRRDPDPLAARALDQHLEWMALHAVPYQGHIAFPGTHLFRLSMDVATGSAGVLLALAAALDGVRLLPFLSEQPLALAGYGLSGGRTVRVGPGGRA